MDFSLTGIYKVAIRDVGLDEAGGYTLSANCLYGSCAISAPTAPVPEPEAYALMLAGLGLISILARKKKG